MAVDIFSWNATSHHSNTLAAIMNSNHKTRYRNIAYRVIEIAIEITIESKYLKALYSSTNLVTLK